MAASYGHNSLGLPGRFDETFFSVKGFEGETGTQADKSGITVAWGEFIDSGLMNELHRGFHHSYRSILANCAKNHLFSSWHWRPNDKKLFLLGSRYGAFPLYFSLIHKRWANYPNLLGLQLNDAEWNISAAADLFATSHILGNETLHTAVELIGPNELVAIDWINNSVTRDRLMPTVRGKHPAGHSLDEASILIHSATNALGADIESLQRTLLPLSGGLDSRLLLAMLLRAGIKPQTYTFGQPQSTDREIAEDIAKRLGIEHLFIEIKPDDFIKQSRHISTWTGGEASPVDGSIAMPEEFYRHNQGSITITGTGSEYGRAPFYDFSWFGKLIAGIDPAQFVGKAFIDAIITRRMTGRLRPVWESVFLPEALTQIITQGETRKNQLWQTLAEAPSLSCFLESLYLEQTVRRFLMPGQQLHGLFLRRCHPFLKESVLDLFADLPIRWKLGSSFHRLMITAICPELSRVVWDKTGKPLTDGLPPLYWWPGCKHRILPIVNFGDWLRGPLKDWAHEMLFCRHLPSFLDISGVTNIWDEHLRGNNRTRILGQLISLSALNQQSDPNCIPLGSLHSNEVYQSSVDTK